MDATRKDLTPSPENILSKIAATWLYQKNPSTGNIEVCLVKRSEDDLLDPYRGKLSLVMETLESDEDMTTTALRGYREELRKSNLGDPSKLGGNKFYPTEGGFYEYQLFRLEVPFGTEFDLNTQELIKYQWLSIDELLEQIKNDPDKFLPALDKVLYQLKDYLHNQAEEA